MTQCDCPTDHGINLSIQFKFVFNSTVQFLLTAHTGMYLYITLTPFGRTNGPPDMAVAHKFSIFNTHCTCTVLP